MALAELSGGLLPVLNEAMPARLVPVLREFLQRHGGARDVGVLLADYELRELRRLSPRDQDDLTVASKARKNEAPPPVEVCTSRTPPTSTTSPVSSTHSRAAAALGSSSASTYPAGRDHSPKPGSMPRCTSRSRPLPSRTTTPTPTFGSRWCRRPHEVHAWARSAASSRPPHTGQYSWVSTP